VTLLLGLTGNIAAGKSTIAAALVSRGATLIDSDVAARAAVAPGTPALRAIVARFGASMLQHDGTLDRAAMGAMVFADADARHALEAIVHPAVEAARQAAVSAARALGAQVVVCDIPLLFEARLAWHFPRILLVDAPAAVRLERMVRTRGLSPDDAGARIRAQMPAALKRPRADLVIDNASDSDALHARLDAVWHQLQSWMPVAECHRAA
jgi:dephospho-CoA kinase